MEQKKSGGKDSFYNLMQCVANGHTVVALGNLHPAPVDNKGTALFPFTADLLSGKGSAV